MGRAEDIFEKIKNEGESAIDEFIAVQESESLFLDFKRSADGGCGARLNITDRNNLAKAISGFGNSEGGVIVWGIDCSQDTDRGDVACEKVPITNPTRFVSWLQGAVSGCTIPPHIGVQHQSIFISGTDKGYIVTLIPKSNHAPHQVIAKGKGEYRYYIRAGSDFVPTPHAVLAGMFGRRPQPHVYVNFASGSADFSDEETILVNIALLIYNEGPGIASNLFMNAKVISRPGINCEISFSPPDIRIWDSQFMFGMNISAITRSEVLLPPETWIMSFIISIKFKPPFTDPLHIDCICGSGQSPSMKFKFENDFSTILALYENLISKKKDGILTESHLYDFVSKSLNLDRPLTEEKK